MPALLACSPSDVILAQLACSLSDIMFCLHSGIANLSVYKHWVFLSNSAKGTVMFFFSYKLLQPRAYPYRIMILIKIAHAYKQIRKLLNIINNFNKIHDKLRVTFLKPIVIRVNCKWLSCKSNSQKLFSNKLDLFWAASYILSIQWSFMRELHWGRVYPCSLRLDKP